MQIHDPQSLNQSFLISSFGTRVLFELPLWGVCAYFPQCSSKYLRWMLQDLTEGVS